MIWLRLVYRQQSTRNEKTTQVRKRAYKNERIRKLAHSMCQRRSWENDISTASQDIFNILWQPKADNSVQKRPPFVPVLSQINSIQVIMLFSEETLQYYSLIKPRLYKVSLSLRFVPPQTSLHLASFPYVLHALCIPFFFTVSSE